MQNSKPIDGDTNGNNNRIQNLIPYGRQYIDDNDISAVCKALRSDFLTTGPLVEEFEAAFIQYTGSVHAVAVSSGTAALHCAMYAIGIGPGDEVIVPAITFAATANCVVYQGGTPVFADIDPNTLLIDPESVKKNLNSRTKAVIAMDYGGQPCDYDSLRKISEDFGLYLVADACHSLGATFQGRNAGTLADLSVFSFHPVKHITTGEGGMITTDNPELAERMRIFRNHGITSDYRQREKKAHWFYEMIDLGYNYRITDIQCALGISQFDKLSGFLARRREIATIYDHAFKTIPGFAPLLVNPNVVHAYHLYVVKVNGRRSRDEVFHMMRLAGIGVNVHYIPVYQHPFYRDRFGCSPDCCPNANQCYTEVLSLPIYPAMTNQEVKHVIDLMNE
jgi:perosamine synthetase